MKLSRLSLWFLSGAFILCLNTAAFAGNKQVKPSASSAKTTDDKLQPTGTEIQKTGDKAKPKESGKEKSKDKSKDKDKPKEDSVYNSGLVSGLKFRSIGPAFCSGRICRFCREP